MRRKISIDAGKGFTKVAVLRKNVETGEKFIKTDKFPSKMTENADSEDFIAGKSYIVTYNDKTYVIGDSGSSLTEREVSKKSLLHKLCTITAIANIVDNGDEVEAIIGCPANLCLNAKTREEYKKYILPEGQHTVTIKSTGEGMTTKTFTVVKTTIAIEGLGIMLAHPQDFKNEYVGIIDIGNLNINIMALNNMILDINTIHTDNKGYRYLLSNITSSLGGQLAINITEAEMEAKLRGNKEKRYFFNKDIENSKEISKEIIEKEINKYIKEVCDTVKNKWNIANTTTYFVGGTSVLLKEEIESYCEKEFGEKPVITDDAEFANVIGFLKMLK